MNLFFTILIFCLFGYSLFLLGLAIGHKESNKFYLPLFEENNKFIIKLINTIKHLQQPKPPDPADWWKNNN